MITFTKIGAAPTPRPAGRLPASTLTGGVVAKRIASDAAGLFSGAA